MVLLLLIGTDLDENDCTILGNHTDQGGLSKIIGNQWQSFFVLAFDSRFIDGSSLEFGRRRAVSKHRFLNQEVL